MDKQRTVKWHPVAYEIFESKETPGDWVAAAVDRSSEGEIYVVIFSGPAAEARAKEYAAWKSAALFTSSN